MLYDALALLTDWLMVFETGGDVFNVNHSIRQRRREGMREG